MKKLLAIALIVLLAGATAVLGLLHLRDRDEQRDLAERLQQVTKIMEETLATLAGYTKYTTYVSQTKAALVGQSKFLAARVDRDYIMTQHIKRGVWFLSSEATVSVTYSVEYSVGFDLGPNDFAISGDKNRITVTLRKNPGLVPSPSVNIRSHDIIGKGVFTDEKGAIIAIQQRLLEVARKQAEAIVKDPAVIALSEKRLGAFLLDFMGKQPGVKFVPAIEFAYK